MIQRTERGWLGHWKSVSKFRFSRNTLLERGETRIVISTIGCSVGEDGDLLSYYETMVFYAKLEHGVYEADIKRRIREITAPFIRGRCHANQVHEDIVAKACERLEAEEDYE